MCFTKKHKNDLEAEHSTGNSLLVLLIGNVLAGLFLWTLLKLSKHSFSIKIDSVRKAHEGLDYQEEE